VVRVELAEETHSPQHPAYTLSGTRIDRRTALTDVSTGQGRTFGAA
jgi:hypothetical protein